MEKFMKITGSGGAKLAQVIGKYGFNKDTEIEIGTVVSPPPNLIIHMNAIGMELEADDLVVSERLLPHTRDVEISVSTSTNSGHSHNVTINQINFKDALKAGDKVIVAYAEDTQLYVVLDKAVRLDGTDS